jgi:hypothetical protein
LKNAAGLAEAVVETFGVRPQLIEGHNGIFEVLLDSRVIYTNRSACSRMPTIPEVLQEIGRRLKPLSGKEHRTMNAFPLVK